MSNGEIAQLFRAVKAVLELQNASRFRIMAYDRAATSIEHLTSEAKDLWDAHQLDDIPGIGESLAEHLSELFATGKVKEFKNLFQVVNPAFFVFLELDGVGAKTADKLSRLLGIIQSKNALQKLQKNLIAHKVRTLEGFGEESEKKLLSAVQKLQKQPKKRILFFRADEVAQSICRHLEACRATIRADSLGSLRRKSATVGDIDLAVATNNAKKVIDCFLAYPGTKEVLARGKRSARIIIAGGQQVDLKTQSPDSYGALLQHFTGSKEHNILLRELAISKGLSLSEYGVKLRRTGKIQKFGQEELFYAALGLDWIPPELREGKDEIEAAQSGKLPDLIDQENIRGDLHVHSNFDLHTSHDLGQSSLDDLADACEVMGYAYFGISEHNPAHFLSASKVTALIRKKSELVAGVNGKMKKMGHPIRCFNGLEVDIRPNGELALPPTAFEHLDYVIASVHSSFGQSKSEMTRRLLKALTYPKVAILGHPTGRLIQKREGYEADWAVLFETCRKKNVALEINSSPYRLDLPEELIKMAVKTGVKMCINTDAHKIKELETMRFGVNNARRGWATAPDIVNCLGYNKFVSWLKDR